MLQSVTKVKVIVYFACTSSRYKTFQYMLKGVKMAPSPLFSWAGRGRRSLVQHKHNTLQVHKHMYIYGSPRAPIWLLCPPINLPRSQPLLFTPWVPYSLGGSSWCSLQACRTHTLFPQTHHTHRFPLIPTQTPFHLISVAGLKAPTLTGESNSNFIRKYRCIQRAYQDRGRCRQSQPPSSHHLAH